MHKIIKILTLLAAISSLTYYSLKNNLFQPVSQQFETEFLKIQEQKSQDQQLPNGYVWGCMNISANLPFCNTSLSIDDRVQDLISRLSLEEKQGLLGADTVHTQVDACTNLDAGVLRLGIPRYLNLVETNSAVASICLGDQKCPSEFPGPMNLAATFNSTLWNVKGQIISTEMRALSNLNMYRFGNNPETIICLSGFGPNINIARDPRFGRISELPGEDPFLSGSYATQYVKGQQEGEDSRYFKMIAGLKHYDAYSVEDNRGSRSFNISMYDFWDTYLPQYEMAITEGNALQVMCSYASENQVPSCANNYLLNQVIREQWQHPDVTVATDCGAISNMVDGNFYASNITDAAAKSLNGGSDIDLGDMFFPPAANGGNGALLNAIQAGMTTEAQVDESLNRILKRRFLTGQFDPLSGQIYTDQTKYGAAQVNSTDSWNIQLDAALQSLILLKNDNNLLPLKQGINLAVVGPQIFAQRDLMEDYAGQACNDGSSNCVITIANVMPQFNVGGKTLIEKGVDLDSTDTSGIQAALDAVSQSDFVILCIGDGYNQEHETLDRINITLPGIQEQFAQQVLAQNKPTIILLINGGVIAIDNLMSAPAIIEGFYPGMRGAEAIARAIFGLENKWGRLPVTMYPADYVNQVNMYNFDMSLAPGRTYKYYTDQPLFPFGHGLSYSNFSRTCEKISNTSINCVVKNTGNLDGDEILQVYHQISGQLRENIEQSHPVPIKNLVDFQRFSLKAGEQISIEFSISMQEFQLTNDQGQYIVYNGTHQLVVTSGRISDQGDVIEYEIQI